ncbi:MAG: hypothetical protein M3068_07130, partial [Gemmatimonadota bacterium]|nr:hypothetical protein [Gemmatimonadota bacterium]
VGVGVAASAAGHLSARCSEGHWSIETGAPGAIRVAGLRATQITINGVMHRVQGGALHCESVPRPERRLPLERV